METQASICQWANETFGTVSSNLRVAARANEEMAELIKCLSMDERHPKAAEEAADVVIVLCRLAERLGVKLDFGLPPGQADIPLLQRAGLAAEWLAVAISGVVSQTANYVVAMRLELCVGNLANVCHQLGTTLQDAIDEKMKTNRARNWKLDGTGHGYHVKAKEQ